MRGSSFEKVVTELQMKSEVQGLWSLAIVWSFKEKIKSSGYDEKYLKVFPCYSVFST